MKKISKLLLLLIGVFSFGFAEAQTSTVYRVVKIEMGALTFPLPEEANQITFEITNEGIIAHSNTQREGSIVLFKDNKGRYKTRLDGKEIYIAPYLEGGYVYVYIKFRNKDFTQAFKAYVKRVYNGKR